MKSKITWRDSAENSIGHMQPVFCDNTQYPGDEYRDWFPCNHTLFTVIYFFYQDQTAFEAEIWS